MVPAQRISAPKVMRCMESEMRRGLLFIFALAVGAPASCERSRPKTGADSGNKGAVQQVRPAPAASRVAVSIFPVYDLVRRVAGSDFEVVLALPPGQPVVGHRPTAAVLQTLASAQLGIAVGMDVDAWFDQALRSAAKQRIRVIHLTDHVTLRRYGERELSDAQRKNAWHEHGDGLHQHAHDRGKAMIRGYDHVHGTVHGHGHGHEHAQDDEPPPPPDPHFWTDPARMADALGAIASSLGQLRPALRPAFEQRAARLSAMLGRLRQTIEGAAGPWRKRTVAAGRSDLGYLADRLRLTIAGVAATAVSAHDRHHLGRRLQRAKAAAVLTTATAHDSNSEVATALAGEMGAPLVEVDLLGGTTDSDRYERTVMRNIRRLAHALR